MSSIVINNLGSVEYSPPPSLRSGLRKVILFPNQSISARSPGGAVYIYDPQSSYRPEILASHVGCGITSAIIPEIDFSPRNILNILKGVDFLDKHFGQGDHFLDFTTGHPLLRKGNFENTMVFLHTHFSDSHNIPTTYHQARSLIGSSKEQRAEYLHGLMNVVGLAGRVYKDWTHNSVTVENGHMVYRKGSIDISETDGIGALALTPLDGIYLYASDWKDYQGSMQHATGGYDSRGDVLRSAPRTTVGNATGYQVGKVQACQALRKNVNRVYSTEVLFLNRFGFKQRNIGYCVPELVIKTKA